jgi:hypothetical protein
MPQQRMDIRMDIRMIKDILRLKYGHFATFSTWTSAPKSCRRIA